VGRRLLRRRRWFGLVAGVTLALTGIYKYRVETYHYDVVDPGVLYRTGFRAPRELATTCRLVQPRTIVALIDEQELEREPFRGEWAFCATRGIRLLPIPIPVIQRTPSTEDVRLFLAVVEARANQPVAVHCAQGIRRTGMMCAAYHMSVLGFTRAESRDLVRRYGRDDEGESIADVLAFIERYDPQSRTVGPPR